MTEQKEESESITAEKNSTKNGYFPAKISPEQKEWQQTYNILKKQLRIHF